MKRSEVRKRVLHWQPTPVLAGIASVRRNAAQFQFAQESGSSDDDTVRVRRRRRAGAGAPGERERAAAPQRRRPGSGAPPPSGGMGGGPRPSQPGGGGIPGGSLGLILIIAVIILAVVFGLPNLTNQGAPEEQTTVNEEPSPTAALAENGAPTATRAAIPTRAAANQAAAGSSTPGQQWTVMLYQDADDKILEKDIYVDLNEAERAGSTERVNIVAQIDRYRGGFNGDGDWTSAKRFYVTQDDDLERVASQQIADLGEVNMADSATLVDFVTWAVQTYPADKYVLILSDHGMGWPGGWSDPAPPGAGDANIPLADRLGNQLYLMEMDNALETMRSQNGIDKFELIGLDACLMGHLEVMAALEPHARYAVASQETEPALGWAYTSFLGELNANPDMSGAELSRLIVDSYIAGDQRIVDDQARAELVGRGQPLGGLFDILLGGGGGSLNAPSAQEVANQLGQNITLTAVDLATIPQLIQSVNELVDNLQGVNQKAVAQARSYAQSYTSVFGKQVPASYIDLGHFAQLLQQTGASGAVAQALDQVLADIGSAVIAEKHGPQRPGATGVSIYFPTSQLYRTAEAGPPSYTAIADRFAAVSLWDDFLLFHYSGRKFGPSANTIAVPDRSTTISAPGAGGIQLSPITLSANVAAPGQPVLLSTRVQGQNVGYIYLFAGFYDQNSNAIFVADMDYLESAETRAVNGVYYPVWPQDGDFTLEFEWEPIVFAINDGTNSEAALFNPETYGAAFEDATYTVDGTYTYVDGESRSARLYFRNGVLHQVFGFTNEGATGSPWEIVPQPGDSFTILEQWMDLDSSGNITGRTTQEGGTLTFGDRPFTWQELDAAAGDYIVGFIVEDLDGNRTQVYERVTVQ